MGWNSNNYKRECDRLSLNTHHVAAKHKRSSPLKKKSLPGCHYLKFIVHYLQNTDCFRVWSFIGFELLLTFEKYNHFVSNFALSIIFARGDVTFFLAGLYPDHSDTAELFVQPVHSRWWLNGILVEYCSQNEAKLRIGGGETQESR